MKSTDYIVEMLIQNKIKHVFGYPGGVITHFIDSLSKYKNQISDHCCRHEQGAAFAACGYASASDNIGVAYSTSGPGGTNLITGIANAFYDSVPVIFITGQVDTYALKNINGIRQRGFQEVDIIEMCKPITKKTYQPKTPQELQICMQEVFRVVKDGRPGPVLIDLPADIQRADYDYNCKECFSPEDENFIFSNTLLNAIKQSKKPIVLIGNGLKNSSLKEDFIKYLTKQKFPIVTSMPAIDLIDFSYPLNLGFTGPNGTRYSNILLNKADLVISIGCRLSDKLTGNKKEFCKQATIVRVDIDQNELGNTINENVINVNVDLSFFIKEFMKIDLPDISRWQAVCIETKKVFDNYSDCKFKELYNMLSDLFPDDAVVVSDVGQNEVWIAQEFRFRANQSFLSSTSLGSMGYSIPASIGAYYANRRNTFSFNGDGGIQMNIQELETISYNKIPIKIIIINNDSLGMIRQFQEKNFAGNYSNTTRDTGYSAPNFSKIASAFQIKYCSFDYLDINRKILKEEINSDEPVIIEIFVPNTTYLYPTFNKGINDGNMSPKLSDAILQELEDIK